MNARAVAFGRELVRAHDWLRAELVRVRAELDADTRPPMSLRAHCLAFCDALTRHHGSEDAVAFPTLAGQVPELAPVLAELSQDHQLIERILRRLRDLLSAVTPETVESARAEIDGLAAIMESHFRWEERTLLDALDELATTRPAEELFGL
jgi:hemerythrin-like domain-containing protein